MISEKQKPKVLIIILNWNGKEDTIECLESLKEINYPNYEIIVVDNGSTDGSSEVIKKKFPEVHLIENKKNLGFAEGNNVGIRCALEKATDYVLLLNNDTVAFDKDFLNILVDYAESARDIGIVGPKILYYKSNKIWFAGGKVSYLTGFCRHVGKGLANEKFEVKDPYEVDYITGCALLLKRRVIEKIGLFNPVYFLYYEEVDLCFRARMIGYKCFLVPQSEIWHKKSATAGYKESNKLASLQAYYFARNGIIFGKRSLKRGRKIAFICAQFSFRLICNLLHCHRKAIKEYFRGLWNGIKY